MASSSFAQMFDEILRREIVAVLTRVADGENLDIDELVTKYLPVDVTPAKETKTKKKRAAKVSTNPEPEPTTPVPTSKCTAVTAKGKPCSLKALAGGCMCRVHLKAAEKPAAPTPTPRGPAAGPVKKPKKVKKTEQPKHTHELDEETHDDCELCQTHGSAMADTDDEEEFETVMSPPRTLRERLATRLEYEDDEDDEETQG